MMAPMASVRLPAASTQDLAFEFGLFMGGEEGAPTYLASGRSFPVRQSLKDSKYFYDALRP
ncbi:MAG: hypothetical protein R3E79_53870 [Caldilineaceae bacterium]